MPNTVVQSTLMPDIILASSSSSASSMAPPSIYGEPKITHNEKTGSVLLEVTVTNVDPSKTKWFYGETALSADDSKRYVFSTSDEGGNRKKLSAEIKNYEKSLQGTYKAVFQSVDGTENYSTFTVQSGNAPDFYDKPKIVQKDKDDKQNVQIKIRAKSHLEMKEQWYKDDKPVKLTDRIKALRKADETEKDGIVFILEISNPEKSDQAKYKCVVKNAEGQHAQSLNLVFD